MFFMKRIKMIIINHIFRKILKKICEFSLKMSIFCNIYLVDKIKIGIVGNSKKSFSLLHLTGL